MICEVMEGSNMIVVQGLWNNCISIMLWGPEPRRPTLKHDDVLLALSSVMAWGPKAAQTGQGQFRQLMARWVEMF